MKRFALIAGVLLVVLGVVFVPLRIRTMSEVRKIRALEGQAGEFGSLVRPIRARYTAIEDAKQMETTRLKLGMTDLTGMRLVRFNGEGMPYFYGYVAYDTNRQTVVKAVVDELW
jgi:hypothetical protein